MRWIPLILLAVLAFVPLGAGSQPQGQDLPGVLSPDELQGVKPEVLEGMYLRARRELRNRRLFSRYMKQYPGADPVVVREKFGFAPGEVLGRYDDDRIEEHLGDVFVEVRRRKLRAPQPGLIRVPAAPLDELDWEVEETVALISDTSIISVGQAVAAIVDSSALSHFGTTWTLSTDTLKNVSSNGLFLCEFSDRYEDPVTKVAGTAFLVEPSVVVTAGHVVDTTSFLTNHRFVFGYASVGEDSVRVTFTDDDVYKGTAILYRTNESGRDAAVIKLERDVVGRTPLDITAGGRLSSTDRVYAIGYPHGLPLTYADAGEVLDNTPCNFFSCDIQIDEFNSGSPVISSSSNSVAGIVISDYAGAEEYCDCWADPSYSVSHGRQGIVASRVGVVADYLAHPTTAVVYNQSGEDALIYNETLIAEVPKGGSASVPAGVTLQLRLDADCIAEFETDVGESWYIRDGPVVGTAEMLRCSSDGIDAPAS